MFLDSSALVEHFRGEKKGERVSAVLRQEPCFISILSLAELAKWCLATDRSPEDYAARARKHIRVVPLEEEACLSAPRIQKEQRKTAPDFGLIDALILASARSIGERLLTCDEDFRGLEDVEIL